jgi:hypothetical protein
MAALSTALVFGGYRLSLSELLIPSATLKRA